MTPHTIEHVELAVGIVAFGLFLSWLFHRLLGASDPKDAAQRELDRKSRWPS